MGCACHMPGRNTVHGADQFVSGVEFDHIVLSPRRCLTHSRTVSSCCAAVPLTKQSGQHMILNSSEETSKYSCVASHLSCHSHEPHCHPVIVLNPTVTLS